MSKKLSALILGITTFMVALLGGTNSVSAWHGTTTEVVNCLGWQIEVDTEWNGYIGIVTVSENLSGVWQDGQQYADWSLTIRSGRAHV